MNIAGMLTMAVGFAGHASASEECELAKTA